MDDYVQMREDAKDRMLSSNEKCRIKDVENFFLLELASLTEEMEGRILTSCDNSYDDKKKLLDAFYFHCSNIRLEERAARGRFNQRQGRGAGSSSSRIRGATRGRTTPSEECGHWTNTRSRPK